MPCTDTRCSPIWIWSTSLAGKAATGEAGPGAGSAAAGSAGRSEAESPEAVRVCPACLGRQLEGLGLGAEAALRPALSFLTAPHPDP